MTNLLLPTENWKQAAASEGVDYDAVRKAFMDQAYGVVANKAKILFQDPYRLGFEIVHRNEKATKMTGFFGFRINNSLIYAPVFFVNGEVKPSDMLYRGDVKRFVPNTEDWCAYLVFGANQEAGDLVDRGGQLQPDAHLERLARPQRTKYAAVLDEIVAQCSRVFEDEPALLLPSYIKAAGVESLEKLASLLEGSEMAQRFVAEHYSEADLCPEWEVQTVTKQASDDTHTLRIISDIADAESQADIDAIVKHGFAVKDKRTAHTVVEEIPDSTVSMLTRGESNVLLLDGSTKIMLALRAPRYGSCCLRGMQDNHTGVAPCTANEAKDYVTKLYNPDSQQLSAAGEFYGSATAGRKKEFGKSLADVSVGDVILLFRPDSFETAADACKVVDVSNDGAARVITVREVGQNYEGAAREILYAPGTQSEGRYLSDDVRALPLHVGKPEGADSRGVTFAFDDIPMGGREFSKWLLTAGGVGESVDTTIKDREGLYDIRFDGQKKKASHIQLTPVEAVARLMVDGGVSSADAFALLDRASRSGLHSARIYTTEEISKSAYITRVEAEHPWFEGFDSDLGVRFTTPEEQQLSTYTPERPKQVSRYGDHFARPRVEPNSDTEAGFPGDAIFTESPERLAELASKYQIPQVFDHGVLGQLANSRINTITQVQQYIPDLETGCDRYFRILFLLRYRPADFEEAYGKDEMLEMEQEIAELAAQAGENLLRMLKRFDASKFSRQSG